MSRIDRVHRMIDYRDVLRRRADRCAPDVMARRQRLTQEIARLEA